MIPRWATALFAAALGVIGVLMVRGAIPMDFDRIDLILFLLLYIAIHRRPD